MYFYQKIKKQEKTFVLRMDTDNKIYEKILSHLIKKEFEKDKVLVTQENYLKVLNENPNKSMILKIPNDYVADDFIKFVEKHLGNNGIKNNIVLQKEES